MASLERTLRRDLENAVKKARRAAEAGARKALEALAVPHHEPWTNLSLDERKLRNRLRAHGRQLGDQRDKDRGTQGITRLTGECAYEHWHRMLFARFLAENDLLMEPETGVAITLAECQELARDNNQDWLEYASGLAVDMLPQIFRSDDPVLCVNLPPETRSELEDLLKALPADTFRADDSLGWVYQFWQAEQKDAVNKSEKKIGAEELPAVTQLFTEDYMVEFLLHNTLGAWWAGKVLAANPHLAAGAKDEEELRKVCAVGDVQWTYLRFIRTSPPGPLSMNSEGEKRDGQEGEREKVEGTLKNPVVSRNYIAPEKLEAARAFRKEPTATEDMVWEWLRDRRMLGLKFRRQQVIEGFIADFYCAEHRIALELDGEVHETDEVRAYDKERDAVFAAKGIHILRVKNKDCTHQYLESLLKQINSSNNTPSPSPFMERGSGGEVWTPAAGTFDGWPRAAKDITMLDPCMGSGHFLVFALPILVAFRMAEESLTEKDAIHAVLRDNLFGLEIDPRCTQIAAFNLALTAWRRVGYRPLPLMNLACSGLAPNTREADWLAVAGDDEKLRNGMARLYRLFENAPVLGSLINPRAGEGDLLVAAFHELQPLLERALAQETKDDTAHEMAVTAKGLAKAAEILADQFTLVATNVPYLGRKKQDRVLMDYCDRVHPAAKADLATCFVERCLDFCSSSTSTALVTPQNWLFLGGYKTLRQRILEKCRWGCVARLGARAFETIGGEIVNVSLVSLSQQLPAKTHRFVSIEVSEEKSPSEKCEALLNNGPTLLTQRVQLGNPDARISAKEHDSEMSPLGDYAECYQGVVTGDLERFRVQFWEISIVAKIWRPFRTTIDTANRFDGLNAAIKWQEGNGELHEYAVATRDQLHDMHESGNRAWNELGVAINRMGALFASAYLGEIFDNNVAVAIPKKKRDLPALLAFCSSPDFSDLVRSLDQTLKVTNRTLLKVPFDLAYWQKIAVEKYPDGLPKPYSSDPTQWLFNGHPKGSDQPLHVAVARLLGYQWPRQTGSSFPDCPALGPDGLEAFADDDGIVCLHPVNREQPAAAHLRGLLAAAFGSEWTAGKERELLTAAGSKQATLEDWLCDGFFEQHCALFHQRPFIWHIWDGRRDGFNALVNYHRLAEGRSGVSPLSSNEDNAAGSRVYSGRRLLEKLIYTYLGDWITRQRQDQQNGVEGADARLAAAQHLQNELKRILEGEPPCDLFVRWKPLQEQAIGWEPDLNDGVRMNIRPFLTARPLNARGKNACILRTTPKIKWDKDRGKEPQRPREDYPWFWGWDEKTQDFAGGKAFDGVRWNNLHYSNAIKQTARERKKGT